MYIWKLITGSESTGSKNTTESTSTESRNTTESVSTTELSDLPSSNTTVSSRGRRKKNLHKKIEGLLGLFQYMQHFLSHQIHNQ